MTERRERRHGAVARDLEHSSPFARDRDLIRHSPEFARLRHVTQVMPAAEPGRFHNRLTHSLAVSRIGRTLTEALLRWSGGAEAAEAAGGLDPAVVEAAALAHDLGHPPFGHDAEDELDRLLVAAGAQDGFEANAQAFRIVAKLAVGDDGPGMNLTRATLSAILKYPWLRGESPAHPAKWGAYATEAPALAWARATMPPGNQRPTLEAEIVDWADLIAYAVLDFEDFARAGLIPLDRLTAGTSERDHFLSLVCQRRQIATPDQAGLATTFDHLLTACPIPDLAPTSRAGRNALRCFCQHQIDTAMNGVALTVPGADSALAIDPATRWAIYLLEGLTWHYVIDGELLRPQRARQRQGIRELFDRLANTALSPGAIDRLPTAHRDRLEQSERQPDRLRVVADLIGSLREEEVSRVSHPQATHFG